MAPPPTSRIVCANGADNNAGSKLVYFFTIIGIIMLMTEAILQTKKSECHFIKEVEKSLSEAWQQYHFEDLNMSIH